MKIIRIIIGALLSIILCGLLIVLIVIVIPVHNTAEEISNVLGETAGNWVGVAAGTYYGITEEAQRGWEDGKEQGLSAEDTEVEVVNSIIKLNNINLQVLEAQISIHNDVSIGNGFYALYVKKGSVIFTVDLSDAVSTVNGNNITILISNPCPTVIIDDSKSIEILAEAGSKFHNDQGKDAIEQMINSRIKLIEDSEKNIDNYSYLYEQAKLSAKEQVKALVQASARDLDVTVKFEGE